MSPRSPQVLLVAHHANPQWGSEPLIGWQTAKALAPRVALTLVTHVRNRAAIEAAGGLDARILWVDTERLAARVHRINERLWRGGGWLNRMFLDGITLAAFDREAVRIAAAEIAAGRCDVIQRVSPISPRYPSRLGRLGVPFVLGPVNGGLRTAPGFGEVDRLERTRLFALRRLAGLFDVGRRTFRDASRVLVANRHSLALVPKDVRARAIVASENGIDPERFEAGPERRDDALRILFVGRLVPCKGVEYLLRALARWELPTRPRLDIVGDGTDRARLEAIAADLGLAGIAHFHGRAPVDAIPAWMADCDVLCLPSVRESGGGVVLEAMASGRPAVVADWGGPPELIGDGGVAVDARSPELLIRGLARALMDLAAHPDHRLAIGRAARRRALDEYGWDVKAERLVAIYRDLLREHRAIGCRAADARHADAAPRGDWLRAAPQGGLQR